MENENIYFIRHLPIEIVNQNCCYYGSTLDGRQRGTSFILGSSHKPPIIMDDVLNLILIPTHSSRNKSCTWIVLNNILNYRPVVNNKTLIEFKNGRKLIINCTYTIFDKQVMRATRLESIIRGRNNKKHL